MLFRDIIGQEATKQMLRQAVREGRIPHAQLFTGIACIGKLQLAFAYSQYLKRRKTVVGLVLLVCNGGDCSIPICILCFQS